MRGAAAVFSSLTNSPARQTDGVCYQNRVSLCGSAIHFFFFFLHFGAQSLQMFTFTPPPPPLLLILLFTMHNGRPAFRFCSNQVPHILPGAHHSSRSNFSTVQFSKPFFKQCSFVHSRLNSASVVRCSQLERLLLYIAALPEVHASERAAFSSFLFFFMSAPLPL